MYCQNKRFPAISRSEQSVVFQDSRGKAYIYINPQTRQIVFFLFSDNKLKFSGSRLMQDTGVF